MVNTALPTVCEKPLAERWTDAVVLPGYLSGLSHVVGAGIAARCPYLSRGFAPAQGGRDRTSDFTSLCPDALKTPGTFPRALTPAYSVEMRWREVQECQWPKRSLGTSVPSG